jgi:hypothetical protein
MSSPCSRIAASLSAVYPSSSPTMPLELAEAHAVGVGHLGLGVEDVAFPAGALHMARVAMITMSTTRSASNAY